MYCENCGHKLDDGARFCENCGAQQGENSHIPADARGNLIVSTKKDYTWLVVWGVIASVVLLFLGSFFFSNPEVFYSQYRHSYRTIAHGVGILMYVGLAGSIISAIMTWNNQKSYVAVYENCIEGYTVVGMNNSQTQFRVPYSELLNISTSTYGIGISNCCISIRTNYVTHKVMAMINRDFAMAEIQKRIAAQRGE